jgi:L-2-hydroxyglutarate oxidase LhgO
MYGKGGCIRYKPYGVENRTLSNAWLQNEERMRWVFRNAVRGMKELVGGNILSKTYGDIQPIINSSDKKEAMKIIKKAKLEVCNA